MKRTPAQRQALAASLRDLCNEHEMDAAVMVCMGDGDLALVSFNDDHSATIRLLRTALKTVLDGVSGGPDHHEHFEFVEPTGGHVD